MNQKLYEELRTVREKLKKKHKGQHICDDQSLVEMATYLPEEPDYFLGIRGCGEVFVEKYTKPFIETIDKYRSDGTTKPLTDEQKNFINRLENRLINISKRNSNLFLRSTKSADFYDLNQVKGHNIVDALFFEKNKRIIELFDLNRQKTKKKIYKSLSKLHRNLDKDVMDRGEYNLYIAYPFIQGKTHDKSFEINAPLAYFPVKLIKRSGRITLKADSNRDPMLNESFLIMAMKFIINKEIDLENTEANFGNISFDNLQDYLIETYKNYGIDLKNTTDKKYAVKLDDDNFNLKVGFRIRNYMILGRFSSFTNSIQRDISQIKQRDDISSNLHKILFEGDMIDDHNIEDPKWDVDQINQLDYSQLKVLNSVDKGNSLIIEGPPGTGKSQVIVSIITNTASKDQNVLMVAEKKAAIDVIYSRLKQIRNYAIIIDDPNNKKDFYQQVRKLLKQEIKKEYREIKEDRVRDKLEKELEKYETIIQDINDTKDYNISLVELMDMYDKISLSSDQSTDYNNLYKRIKKTFKNDTYDQTKDILKNLFIDMDDDYSKLFDIIHNHPHITYLRKRLDFEDFMSLNQILKAYKENRQEKGILGRIGNRLMTNLKLLKYVKKRRKLIKHVLQHPISDNDYNLYKTYTGIWDEFKEIDKKYRRFYQQINLFNRESKANINYKTLLLFYGNFLIRSLQKSKKSTIRKYAKTKQTIDHLYNYYHELIKHNILKLNNMLNERAQSVKKMKRYSSMLKAINSKRLPNIASFIKKYEFEINTLIRIWLMTPNGVSTLLPLKKNMFDLNIFDEASQMYFERSVPTIYRAKRTVIAGDLKQLRPSSFGFGRLEGVNDEDYVLEEYSILDDDSLLDFVKPKLPSVRLEYHYRSRFQELINISNYLFYERDLVVPPYKNYEPKDPPLKYIKIDNGIWEDKHNYEEALKVVDTLEEILKIHNNKKSIGIITFNIHQRDLIEELIDDRAVASEEFNQLYLDAKQKVEDNEQVGLFVKNIENVQGDQRDIILISVGYSYNEEGVFQRQFGWLSQKYGENRLNVCVTRAKYKTYVFVSFELHDFDTKNLKHNGPRFLKNYLQYAQLISNNEYQKSVEFINSLIEKDSEEETQSTLNVGKDPSFKIYDVKGVKGSPVDYMLLSENVKEGIGLLLHKPHHRFQRDYYFLEKYLEWIEAKHERVNLFHFWESKENYITNILKKHSTKEK